MKQKKKELISLLIWIIIIWGSGYMLKWWDFSLKSIGIASFIFLFFVFSVYYGARKSNELHHQHRLKTLLREYETSFNQEKSPESKIEQAFELGCIHWGHTGDGESAQHWFEKVNDVYLHDPSKVSEKGRTITANACENLMLLSKSYEDYENWVKRVSELRPDYDILKQHTPKMRDGYNKGIAWRDLMIVTRLTYSRDVIEQVASAACILQRILQHRKFLRINMEMWSSAVQDFTTSICHLVDLTSRAMQNAIDNVDFEEIRIIAEVALPLIREYVESNPNDTSMQGRLAMVERAYAESVKRIPI